MDKCYLCNSENIFQRDGKVRDKPVLKVLECGYCGLVFLSDFSHIKDEYYESEKMYEMDEIHDVEGLLFQAEEDDNRRFEYYREKIRGKDILDFGCGPGGFIIKNIGNCNVSGIELEKRMRDFLRDKNIECFREINEIKNKEFDYVFFFHTLEHLKNPVETLKSVRNFLKPSGKIVVEVPNSNDALISIYNCREFKNFTYWSPHLFLFNERSLVLTCQKSGYNIVSVEQTQRYPYTNHLCWVINGKSDGYKDLICDESFNRGYKKLLTSSMACDTLSIEISLKEA